MKLSLHSQSAHRRPTPGPSGLPFLGSALDFRRDPLALMKDSAARYGDFTRLKLGAQNLYLANSPALVKHILKDNASNYTKNNLMYEAMATLFGKATAIVDGDRWRQGFQLIQPSFTKESSERAVPLFMSGVQSLVADWKAGDPVARDVSEDISNLTLQIIVRQMFGRGLGGEEETITRSFRWLVDFIADRVTSVVKIPLGVPTARHRKFHQTLAALDRVMYRVIEERWKADVSSPSNAGMLGAWIQMVKAGQIPGFGPREIRDEVIGIFVAAHGSTAVFLSWVLHHLGTHPEVQDRARAEIENVTGGKPMTYGDLDQLHYLNAIIHESMRISPPGWVISRSATEADSVGDHHIPAGAMVLVSPYLMHHREDVFPNPSQFDPERFSPERADWVRDITNDCAYIPFAAGKRICTGRTMALVESMILIGSLIQNFKMRVPAGRKATPVGRFTLNLKGGLILERQAIGH